MHKLGVALAFLLVIAAGVASVFTAKLIQVRNSWTAKTVASKGKYINDLQPKIEATEAKIDSLKAEIFRSRELWGSFWNGVQTSAVGDGLNVNIGTDNGLRDKMLIYAFEIGADGSSVYRGSFFVAAVQNGSANLKPNWRVSPEEIKTWQPGNWRWRNNIPSGYQEIFDKQLLVMLKHEETLKARRGTLEGQKELLNKANLTLKQREAELVGGDVLGKAKSVLPEFRDGLVAAIEKSEEERNLVLRKIDELRRKVRNIEADILKLQEENAALTSQLPEPSQRADVTSKQ